MNIYIETERLVIRLITRNDAPFILKLLNTDGWKKQIGDKNVLNEADAADYIQKTLDTPFYHYYVFGTKETNEPIGVVSFIKRSDQEHPDIGFALLPQYERKGYAYEATRSFLNKIIELNQFEQMMGITLSDNVRSIKLLQKLSLSFVREYVENDEILSLYSLNMGTRKSINAFRSGNCF